jgi:hypothetical protein
MLNEASHDFFVSIQGSGCGFFIFPHEAAVAFDICTEDGSEFAFNFLCGHGVPPLKSYNRKERV